MSASTSGPHLILTANGVEGASSAALLLKVHPYAQIRFTSPRHLPVALSELIDTRFRGTVHICGIGISPPVSGVLQALSQKTEDLVILWYSGSNHPELVQHRKALSAHGTLYLKDSATDTGAIANQLGLQKTERALLLIELAEDEQAGKKPRTDWARFCQDLVLAANRRFFFFGDDALNEQTIRYMAELEGKSDGMDKAVEEYRRSEDALYPLGASKAMKSLRKQIGRMGPIPEPVLVLGPTGSGKEVVARALHVTSGRRGAFVAVNCAVLGGNPALVEDRLFGHVKGAYTGATGDAKGAFEEANGGTLFLDEIGELPPDTQSQLLRVLEEKAVRPLGTVTMRSVDVRIIAATHRPLPEMISEGKFREDLFYRLNVLRVQVPPLRERPEDMRSIAASVRQELEPTYALQLKEEDWRSVREYHWPGNVRQFINILKRAAYLDTSVREILKEEAEPGTQATVPMKQLRLFMPENTASVRPAEEIYEAYLRHVLDVFDGNILQAARALQIAPNTLRKRLGK
jgi:DNA-binding NtrC family response regulator